MNVITRWGARHGLLWAAGLCVSLVAWAPDASAADDEVAPSESSETRAARLFAEAETLFEAREYERAARLFLRADENAPHASVMYNAAISWDYAGKRAPAADCYQTALERGGLTPQQQTQAERRIDELGKNLGLVHVAKPEGGLASIDRFERREIPFQFFQEPGSFRVELETAAGAKTATEITVLPGQTLRLELNPVENQATVSPVPRDPESRPAPPPPALPLNVNFEDEPSHAQEVIGWVSVGIGVVAAGTAAYLGYQTLQKRDAYDASGETDAQARKEGVELKTLTNIGWASSALTTTLGLTLVLTSPTFRF